MTIKKTEQITSFKPLTGSQRDKLWLLKHFAHIVIWLLIAACVGAVLSMWKNWSISRNVTNFVLGIATALVATSWVLTKQSRRAKRMLKLDGQAVAYVLEPRAIAAADGGPSYRVIPFGPFPPHELRARMEADYKGYCVITAIFPLRRNQPAEIHIRSDGGTLELVDMKQMQLKIVEAHWGADAHLTDVVLADKDSLSASKMDVDVALRRIYDNRSRIATSNLDFLWSVMEHLLICAEHNIKSIADELAQCEADRSRLVSDVTDAATMLSRYEKFQKAWGPACEVGMSLVRTTNSCPSRNPAEQTRIVLAKAEFEKGRKTT